MIVVTGGAGFIGSSIIWALNKRGISDILVVDRLHSTEKWKNLVPLKFVDYLDKDKFIDNLESNHYKDSIEAIFHLGACSATTEKDADYLMENNYRYTRRIAEWWESHQSTRYIYASSAATYGAGEMGYSDDESALHKLKPLNMYGYSKHLFDLCAKEKGWLEKIVGIKYFNVYGPNEYHKADMRSLINKAFEPVCKEGVLSLFKSHREGYGDGEQKRDFIYVKDAVAMTLFFYDNKHIGGIYNVGTGNARTWNDVAKSLFDAVKKPTQINYIPMPEHLQGKYQYFTEADLRKLRDVGCSHECMSLESAIKDYALTYLSHNHHLGEE